MAGDLFIESISADQLRFLKDAHGTVGAEIYHANRSGKDSENALRECLKPTATTSMRRGLPAHAYVTFRSEDRMEISRITAITKGRLGNVLEKVSRPLGLVSEKAYLANWDFKPSKENKKEPTPGLDRAEMLIAAVREHGTVIIEYYKFEGNAILLVPVGQLVPGAFAWTTHNE